MGGGSTSLGDKPGDYNWADDEDVIDKSAKSYAKKDKREYTGDSSKGIEAPVGKEIKTDSKLAAILMVDVTGSMREWPHLIFEKIPALYQETNAILQGANLDELSKGKKLEDLLDLSVIAIGDARCDEYPLQVLDFSKGKELVKGVNQIYPEGHGGGNAKESYDLAEYFIVNHCKTPNIPKNVKPLVIIAGDEGFYDQVGKQEVKALIGDKLDKNLDTMDVMNELNKRFDTFILRPEEEYDKETYKKIHNQWQKALGNERVYKMKDPKRLVDCIVGISSIYADKFDLGVKMLERRQTPEQVRQVLDTLHPHPTAGKYKK